MILEDGSVLVGTGRRSQVLAPSQTDSYRKN